MDCFCCFCSFHALIRVLNASKSHPQCAAPDTLWGCTIKTQVRKLRNESADVSTLGLRKKWCMNAKKYDAVQANKGCCARSTHTYSLKQLAPTIHGASPVYPSDVVV